MIIPGSPMIRVIRLKLMSFHKNWSHGNSRQKFQNKGTTQVKPAVPLTRNWAPDVLFISFDPYSQTLQSLVSKECLAAEDYVDTLEHRLIQKILRKPTETQLV